MFWQCSQRITESQNLMCYLKCWLCLITYSSGYQNLHCGKPVDLVDLWTNGTIARSARTQPNTDHVLFTHSCSLQLSILKYHIDYYYNLVKIKTLWLVANKFMPIAKKYSWMGVIWVKLYKTSKAILGWEGDLAAISVTPLISRVDSADLAG